MWLRGLISNQLQTKRFGDWFLKIRQPDNRNNNDVVVLLHGWTGDENSMWVFGPQIPENSLVISLRAPYSTIQTDLGGFSWVDKTIDFWPTYQDFIPSVYQFVALLDEIKKNFSWANFEKISLVGFSQGAAMAVSILLEFPLLVKKMAVLAGFMPDGAGEKILYHKHCEIFIGHGEFDNIVPIAKAEETEQFFESNEITVVYCNSQVEHRLGRECAFGLKDFLTE